LEDMEKASFDKAQAMISAQVFHEIRNALSSVIAMSEMTSTLQDDPTVCPNRLISSVSDMMNQNEEVVRYSLNMLNNILDVSKIKTGTFEINVTPFDLTDLVQRATSMQLVKAQTKGVKMTFEQSSSTPVIAHTDKDIVLRIVTNFISNSVKFTTSGCVQPFILPLEAMASVVPELHSNSGNGTKMVCVGVADTGRGLSQEVLEKAEQGLYNSDSGVENNAKNSGFGLHLAHQLSKTLGTRLYLGDISRCKDVLNQDMSNIVKQHELNLGIVRSKNALFGSVLFIVVPVIESDSKLRHSSSSLTSAPTRSIRDDLFLFVPQPVDGDCFRVLIADDVLMLRKGLARSVLQAFEPFVDCRVEVHTTCTAEDALRVMRARPFDIVIFDNQFVAPSARKDPEDVRHHILLEEGRSEGVMINSLVSEYFRNEFFGLEKGDGTLSGLQALLQVLSDDLFVPKPIPILLSGHKFELDNKDGLIVAQKPMRASEFVPLLEASAKLLIKCSLCSETDDGNGMKRIVNQRGNQMFACK